MAGNLTTWEVAEFKEAFALFDQKKTGSIDDIELRDTMAKLGQECTENEIKDMIDEVDELGTGRIDFPSFLKQFQHSPNEDPNEFVDEAYKLINNDNPIDGESIESFLNKVNIKLIREELNEIVKTGDNDGDGAIGKKDFEKLFLKH